MFGIWESIWHQRDFSQLTFTFQASQVTAEAPSLRFFTGGNIFPQTSQHCFLSVWQVRRYTIQVICRRQDQNICSDTETMTRCCQVASRQVAWTDLSASLPPTWPSSQNCLVQAPSLSGDQWSHSNLKSLKGFIGTDRSLLSFVALFKFLGFSLNFLSTSANNLDFWHD